MPSLKKAHASKLAEAVRKNIDYKGGRVGGLSYFQKELDGESIPVWVPAMSDKGTTHIFDIVPYIAGDNWPSTDNQFGPGDTVFTLHTWVHTAIGPNLDNILCPKQNYGLPCPICDDFNRRQKRGEDYELIKYLRPKHRNMVNVIPYTTNDTDEGECNDQVCIFEVSNYFFMNELASLSRSAKSGEVIPYASPMMNGKSIQFIKKTNGQMYKMEGFRFEDRDYELDQEILDDAWPLEDLLILHSEEKIHEMYMAHKEFLSADDEPEEDTPVAPKRGRRVKDVVDNEVDDACPAGGTYGVNFDVFEDCGECPLYDDCKEETERNEEIQGDIGEKESALPPRRGRRR